MVHETRHLISRNHLFLIPVTIDCKRDIIGMANSICTLSRSVPKSRINHDAMRMPSEQQTQYLQSPVWRSYFVMVSGYSTWYRIVEQCANHSLSFQERAGLSEKKLPWNRSCLRDTLTHLPIHVSSPRKSHPENEQRLDW